MDAATFGADVVEAVRSFLEQEVDPLLAKITALEAEVDRLKAMPTPKEIDRAALVAEVIAALPPAEKGKDADPEHVASLVKEEAERILWGWERPQDGKDGAQGEKGVDGKDGRDGKDGADIIDVVIDREGNAVFTLSDGRMKNVGMVVGKDGEPGRDGANGAPGKDGVDGVGFDDMDLVETEQGIVLRFTRGDVVKDFRLPIVTDRGVFKEGSVYRKGDGVTWGGSFWIAQDETVEKPDSGKGWRLAVKKGRDGRDGTMKPPTKPGPVKVS
jgi:hypothetical protein